MGDKIKLLQEIIDKSNNIVFFDGAGTSTDSGIKDFRGKNGLYKEKTKYNPEYLLSANCFYNNTSLFYDYYKSNFNVLDKKPNIIHKYLTTLESKNKLKAIITQNIDGLHKLSGSKNVIEIHGSILTNHCIKCNKKYDAKYIFESNGKSTKVNPVTTEEYLELTGTKQAYRPRKSKLSKENCLQLIEMADDLIKK